MIQAINRSTGIVEARRRTGDADTVLRDGIPNAGRGAEVFDVSGESEATKKLYGLDDPKTADFGWQCLLARRLGGE